TDRLPHKVAEICLNPEVGSPVSGHGFSRAADLDHSQGFSPRLFGKVRRTCALGLPSQGLKPSRCIRSARLKPCPDTKPGLSKYKVVEIQFRRSRLRNSG